MRVAAKAQLSYIVFSIYIYLQDISNIFLCFLRFHQKKGCFLRNMTEFVAEFHKTHRTRGGFRKYHSFLREFPKKCVYFYRYASFRCILLCFPAKRSSGNDNGKFTDHFDAKQTTRKRNGVCKTFFSRNITRHPDNAMRLAVWRSFLIFHKNFCIIYIQSKGKNKLFRYTNFEKKEILYAHFTQSSKGFFI